MRRAILSIILLVVSTLALASPANAYACGNVFNYRGYDFASGVTTAKGVKSVIQLPASGIITGVAPGRGPSAADVYLISGADFVQAGWYVGDTSTGLPYTTTPRFWVGEYYPGQPGNEILRAGPALSWGSVHTVTISFASAAGVYEFYLDGVYKFKTLRVHFNQAQAAFNGEIAYACVRMDARAQRTPAAPTLQYATFGTGGTSWHNFVDSRGTVTSGGVTIVSTSAGSTASDYSYGGGS